MKRHYPLDRSAAFTALLEVSEEFRQADSREGTKVIDVFLADWYKSPSLNMYEFAREWAKTYYATGR